MPSTYGILLCLYLVWSRISEDRALVSLGAIVALIGLAIVSYRYVEAPVLRSRWATRMRVQHSPVALNPEILPTTNSHGLQAGAAHRVTNATQHENIGRCVGDPTPIHLQRFPGVARSSVRLGGGFSRNAGGTERTVGLVRTRRHLEKMLGQLVQGKAGPAVVRSD
jgi:hypothetical protein